MDVMQVVLLTLTEVTNVVENTTTPVVDTGSPGEQLLFADVGTVYISAKVYTSTGEGIEYISPRYK